jgi:hypothetical protein
LIVEAITIPSVNMAFNMPYLGLHYFPKLIAQNYLVNDGALLLRKRQRNIFHSWQPSKGTK